MPRVLVVSYHFPPRPGVASARVAKLVKYLPAAGWDPMVVAADADVERDDDLLADVNGVDVVRVDARRGLPSLQRLDWAAPAWAAAHRLARSADVVLVSGGPFAPLLLGRALRRPYVVDLRDPWSWEPRFDRFKPGMRRRLGLVAERRAEGHTLRRAAAVTTVGPEIAEAYAPLVAPVRVHLLRHGYDPDDFAGPSPSLQDPPVLLHAGTMLTGERTPALILETARLVRSRGIPLHVQLVGHLPDDLASLAADAVHEGWAMIGGRVPRRAATAAMRAASVLWLEPGPLDFVITGKIYEYLATGRPIVAVASAQGSVARLLRTTGGGVVVPDPDPVPCADAVVTALAGGVPPRDETAIAALAHPELARTLAEILTAAASTGAR